MAREPQFAHFCYSLCFKHIFVGVLLPRISNYLLITIASQNRIFSRYPYVIQLHMLLKYFCLLYKLLFKENICNAVAFFGAFDLFEKSITFLVKKKFL